MYSTSETILAYILGRAYSDKQTDTENKILGFLIHYTGRYIYHKKIISALEESCQNGLSSHFGMVLVIIYSDDYCQKMH